jgi:hypothetical protein
VQAKGEGALCMLTSTEIPSTSISSPIADIQKEDLMKLVNLVF